MNDYCSMNRGPYLTISTKQKHKDYMDNNKGYHANFKLSYKRKK